MFAVIYRGFFFPEKEKDYQENWHIIAEFFKKERGALGSVLHQTSSGEYIAYSRWPSKETRDASWGDNCTINPLIDRAIALLRSCIDPSKPYEEICMNVMDDLAFPLSIKD